MPIILLIRHGENQYVKKNRLAGRIPDVHLNEKGREQAQILAENIRNAPIKAVYSSPLERTMETAAPIAESLNLEVIPRPGLIEIDYGDWQDKTLKSLRRRKLWKIVQGAPSHMNFPGGESFAEAQLRVRNELKTLSFQHKPKEMLVCVSHADIIKLAVTYFLGMPLDSFQRMHVAPASITTIHLGEAGCHLLNFNYEFSFNLREK